MWKYLENLYPDDNRYIYIIWKSGKQEDWLWTKENRPYPLNEVLLWKYRGED